MADYKIGEVVDITIKGARVVLWAPQTCELTVESRADANSDQTTYDLASDQITVERADPEWWPPRPGDLLREGDGLVWFAFADGSNVSYRTAYSERMEHQEAWEKRHELTLVHREDSQDGDDRG
ncbi:hypothetical protein ACFY4C_20300 [Actinomadura viridis]|uniref:hypothetical protein n=1 Tax=Actinomadura viridis TaxID=58110 RepID=UPI0036A36F0F